jgi:hypothetical protein
MYKGDLVLGSYHLMLYVGYIVEGGFPLEVDCCLLTFIIPKAFLHNIWNQRIDLMVLHLQVSHPIIFTIMFIMGQFQY